MVKVINFSGISFEVGQSKSGLSQSSIFARNYFSLLLKNGIQLIDQGDIDAQTNSPQIKIFSTDDFIKIQWMRYKEAYLKTLALLKSGIPLLNWGGDHSIAIATAGAFINHYDDGHVLWIDAHADLNPPCESLTGYLHGMPLAFLLNLKNISNDSIPWIEKKLDPKKLIYIGLRDIDPFEAQIIEELNIKTFTHIDIAKKGILNIAKEILAITSGRPIHISFDIDSMDPNFAPSTGVQVANGLTPKDLIVLSEQLLEHAQITSMDIVEINPQIGCFDDVNQTYLTAINFIKTIFNNKYSGELYDRMGKRNQRKHPPEMERSL